jgi:hypothetical protein
MFHGCFTKDREESYDLGYDSTALQYITVATYYCPKVYSNQKIFSDLEKKNERGQRTLNRILSRGHNMACHGGAPAVQAAVTKRITELS